MDGPAYQPYATPTKTIVAGDIAVIANAKSGTNVRDADAIRRAMNVFGDRATLYQWEIDQDPADVVRKALNAGAGLIVAAGGDGTAMAVASALLGKKVAMAVLPLGTFNYFARGLGLPQEPAEAARAILEGHPHSIRVGKVNGRVFLNNASLGIYPAILKERETVYARWGRRRMMAHWSVAKTFLRFQRPMKLRVTADGQTRELRTPLLFVARSAYQLEMFGLHGEDAIHDDRLAVFIGRGDTRFQLFRLAWRLVTRHAREGRDYDLFSARELVVETRRRRALVAFDGEKSRDPSPFRFRMADETLTIIVPEPEETA